MHVGSSEIHDRGKLKTGILQGEHARLLEHKVAWKIFVRSSFADRTLSELVQFIRMDLRIPVAHLSGMQALSISDLNLIILAH